MSDWILYEVNNTGPGTITISQCDIRIASTRARALDLKSDSGVFELEEPGGRASRFTGK